MDISDMIAEGKTPGPVDDHEVINLDAPDEGDGEQNDAEFADTAPPENNDGPEMTAVDRIKAYRDGSLVLPMVGRLDNADEAPVSDEGDEDEGDVESDSDSGPSIDESGDSEADPNIAPGNSSNFLAGFPGIQLGRRLPRKAWMIGVPALAALVAAGVIVPGLGHHGQAGSNSSPAGATQGSAQGQSTTTRPASVNTPNAVIKPVSAEGPEYPISVTKPMDAFSGDKSKGWVCAGLFGTVLTITLPGPTAISEIDLLPGLVGTDADGASLWAKHLLVARVSFGFDYGDPAYTDYADKQQMQATTFHNVISKVITITILELRDISGKGPGAGATAPSATNSPGILGDLGSLKLDPGAPTAPAPNSGDGSRPPTFAIGAIQIMGHTPN